MKVLKYFFAMCMLVTACEKQETMYYQGEARISFYLAQYEIDSLNYSFAFDPIPKDVDTVYVKMRIQGPTLSRERIISVKAGEGTTAVLGIDFELPTIKLPAGANVIDYPLVIFNSSAIKNKSVKVVLQVAESEDFLPGATGQEIGGTSAVNSYKVWLSNKLDKPAYWDDVLYYFGEFSEVRLRFMISTLGISDFSRASIGAYGLYNYPLSLRNALVQYEAQNGPLIDEFGNPVTF